MALATRCPHCETAFRVASDQLKLRAGLVRCGTCKQIFNGIENLLHPDEDVPAALSAAAPPSADAPLLMSPDDTPHAGVAAEPEAATPDDGASGHATVESGEPGAPSDQADTGFATADQIGTTALHGGIRTVPAAELGQEAATQGTAPNAGGAGAVAGATTQATADAERAFDATPDSESLWLALTDDPPYPEPESVQLRPGTGTAQESDAATPLAQKSVGDTTDFRQHETDPAVKEGQQPRGTETLSSAETIPPLAGLLRAARVDDDVLTRPARMPARPPRSKPVVEAKPAPEISNLPDFVVREQKRQGKHRALRPILWIACGLLALILIVQSIYAARTALAANFPQTRPALDAACRWLGCSVGLPMQIESVSIESSDFQPVTGSHDLFLLTVLLRNRGTTVQGWPSIELTLNDAADKVVGRRVIMPREYLPAGQNVFTGFASGSEQPVKLYFNLTQLKALGYRVYLFYP